MDCGLSQGRALEPVGIFGHGTSASIREHLLLAATCLTSVSSDGHLTVAALTFEPQRQPCDVKLSLARVSDMPGPDPETTFENANLRPKSGHSPCSKSS